MRSLVPLVVLAACGGKKANQIDERDRARLDAALATADARAAKFLEERTRGLREAVAHPPELAGPCTLALPPPNAMFPPNAGGPETAQEALQALGHFTLVPSWALAGAVPPPGRSEREQFWARRGLEGSPHNDYSEARTYFTKLLASGTYDTDATADSVEHRIAELGRSNVFGWELVVVTETWDGAHRSGEQEFRPGQIRGRAFLWSFDEHQLRCAGTVDATSSPSLDGTAELPSSSFVETDLEARAFSAAITGLHELRRK